MKALVVTGPGRAELLERPVPDTGPGDVLVRVEACAICGSDVHGYDGSSGRRVPPIIMGHEAAGVVERVGDAVRDFRPGERVTFDSTEYCGGCYYCRRGMVNLCEHRRVLGVSCGEYRRDGAMAEYIAVPARLLYRLPDGVRFEQAAMVEPLSIAVHAVNRSPLRLGDRAAVVGCGAIGLLLVQTLRAAGCSQIIAVDVDERKLDMARGMGATHAVRSGGDAAEQVRGLTGGRGADVTFEAVGLPATFTAAVDMTRRGGGAVLVGNVSASVPLNLQQVVTSQIGLYASCASAGEYDVCLSLIAAGRVDVDGLISARAPLAGGDAWLARLHAGEPGLVKVILNPQAHNDEEA